MPPEPQLLIRPRTTGEILDDAWRLALADFPLLFVLDAMFLVPFFVLLMVMVALPAPATYPTPLALPFVTAFFAIQSGIGAGACQEFLRWRIEGGEPKLVGALAFALTRNLAHVAARALLLPIPVFGLCALFLNAVPVFKIVMALFCLVLPIAGIWMGCFAVHALIAAPRKGRRGIDLKEIGRDFRFNAAKTAAVILSRVPLLALVMLNLHLFGMFVLWAADNLAGFDTALISFACALSNPVYVVSLGLLAWLLLCPYFEASNALLYLDTRTRQEGLDLFYRVRRLFPLAEKQSVGAVLAVVLGLALASPARASELVVVARNELAGIAAEVKSAEPYPGSDHWLPRMSALADRLEEEGGNEHFAWFRREFAGLAQRDRDGMLALLTDLDRRLERVDAAPELAKDDLKKLLRPLRDREEEPSPGRRQEQKEPRRREREEPPEVPRDVDAPPPGRAAPAISGPGGGEAGNGGTMLVLGLLLALVVTALLLWLRRRGASTIKPPTVTAGKAVSRQQELPRPDETPPPSLWRKAEELAAKGEYLEALRVLHAAVLALLHRRRFVRYEPTRTNGEYVDQLRRAADAPPGLREPFERLTDLFEWKWYGERACDDRDFAAGRNFAEAVRTLMG